MIQLVALLSLLSPLTWHASAASNAKNLDPSSAQQEVSPSKLLGSWTGNTMGANLEMTFRADGTFVSEFTVPQLPKMKIDLPGKYRETTDKLYLTFLDLKVTGVTPEQEKGVRAQILKTLKIGAEQPTTLRWISETQFTTTDGVGETKLTKKVAPGEASPPPAKLLGSWASRMDGAELTMTYRPDSTFSCQVRTKQLATLRISMSGVYRVAGDDFYVTFKDIQVAGLPGGQSETVKDSMSQSMQLGQERASKLTWISDIQFSISDVGGGGLTTFTKTAGSGEFSPVGVYFLQSDPVDSKVYGSLALHADKSFELRVSSPDSSGRQKSFVMSGTFEPEESGFFLFPAYPESKEKKNHLIPDGNRLGFSGPITDSIPGHKLVWVR
jgi:hypothetical protein